MEEKIEKPTDRENRQKLDSMIDRNIAWLYGSHHRKRSIETIWWVALVLAACSVLYYFTN